jgi:hypothetical protein
VRELVDARRTFDQLDEGHGSSFSIGVWCTSYSEQYRRAGHGDPASPGRIRRDFGVSAWIAATPSHDSDSRLIPSVTRE